MVYDDKYAPHDHRSVVLLQRPGNVGIPQPVGRLGRAFARLDAWKASVSAEVEPAIVISESSADWANWGSPSVDEAGVVYVVRLPLPAPNADPLVAVSIDNAFGSTPLLEPPSSISAENDSKHHFGTWIVPIDYHGDVSTYGQQFIVSARDATRVPSSTTYRFAGRAYVYWRPGP